MVQSWFTLKFQHASRFQPNNFRQITNKQVKKNTSLSSRPHAFSRGFGAKAGNRARGFSGAAHNFLSYRSDSDNFLSWGHGVMCGHCAIKVHISKDSFKLRHFAALLKPWSYPSLSCHRLQSDGQIELIKSRWNLARLDTVHADVQVQGEKIWHPSTEKNCASCPLTSPLTMRPRYHWHVLGKGFLKFGSKTLLKPSFSAQTSGNISAMMSSSIKAPSVAMRCSDVPICGPKDKDDIRQGHGVSNQKFTFAQLLFKRLLTFGCASSFAG